MHRDLKLQNVILTKKNGKTIAKLCDFGQVYNLYIENKLI